MIDWGFIPWSHNVYRVYRANTPFGLIAFSDDDFWDEVDPKNFRVESHNHNADACVDGELVISFFSDNDRLFNVEEILAGAALVARKSGRARVGRHQNYSIQAYTFNYNASDLSLVRQDGFQLVIVPVDFKLYFNSLDSSDDGEFESDWEESGECGFCAGSGMITGGMGLEDSCPVCGGLGEVFN